MPFIKVIMNENDHLYLLALELLHQQLEPATGIFLDKENITPYFRNYHLLLFPLFRSMVKARIYLTETRSLLVYCKVNINYRVFQKSASIDGPYQVNCKLISSPEQLDTAPLVQICFPTLRAYFDGRNHFTN